MSWDADAAAAWQRHLEKARWFSGKGRSGQVRALTALAWYTPAGSWPAVRSELATVSYPDGPDEVFQLVVGYAPPGTPGIPAPLATVVVDELGDVELFDATDHGESLTALVGSLVQSPPTGMRWLEPSAIDPRAPMRRYLGEQSNTTVILGETALLKLFRKLEPGVNPDAEVLERLSGQITPRLFGALTGRGYELGMFYQRITGVTDGWVYATSSAAAAGEHGFAGPARQLGEELAALHDELAQAFGTADRSGDELAAAMLDRYRSATVAVPELAEYAGAVARIFGGLRGLRLATQRVHGDFHLGQALHRSDKAVSPPWVIIDFEGEPLKSLSERRAFDSPVRDVAGALRSLDYARSAATDPDSAAALGWTAEARQAFLGGYYQHRPAQAPILRSYLLDKAIYEVVYEVRNRPGWAHIPLRAVQDELVRAQGGPTIRPKEF